VKRSFVLPLLAGALVFSVSAAWGAAPTEPPASRACLDINGGTGFNWDGTTLTGSITLTAPACKQGTYTLYVLNQAGGTLLASVAGVPFAGDPRTVQFTAAVQDQDSMVCVYATSSIGGRVFDVGAPDGQQCLVVDTTPSSGGTPFH